MAGTFGGVGLATVLWSEHLAINTSERLDDAFLYEYSGQHCRIDENRCELYNRISKGAARSSKSTAIGHCIKDS